MPKSCMADGCHLRHLIKADNRIAEFSTVGGGIFFDYSRQRVDTTTLELLLELAVPPLSWIGLPTWPPGKRSMSLKTGPPSTWRPGVFRTHRSEVDGRDVKPDLKRVREQIRTFSETVHRGDATGSTGRAFRHVVVVGIGGSYLGTEFVARALEAFADKGISLGFFGQCGHPQLREHLVAHQTGTDLVDRHFQELHHRRNHGQRRPDPPLYAYQRVGSVKTPGDGHQQGQSW